MAYSEVAAQRIYEALGDHPEVVKTKLIGGLVTMAYVHLFCGMLDEMLMVRVGPEQYVKALDQLCAPKMDFTASR